MMLALWERALPVSQLTLVSCPLSDRLYATLSWSSRPQRWLAVLAEKSSDNERKIFVRKVWRSVRQLSPGSADRSELMLCVAMIGMHLGWRERLKNFSSPVGSLSPTVAKCWYSSQRKRTCRKYCSGCASIFGTRLSTARSKSSFIMTPRAFASPAFMPMGKLSAQIAPCSINQENDGRGLPSWWLAFLAGS